MKRGSLLAALLPATLPLSLADTVRISIHDTNDISPPYSDKTPTSPDLARRILARRLGRPDSAVGTADEKELQELNRLGGHQQPLFGEDLDERPGRLFVVVENVEDQALFDRQPARNEIDVHDAPSDIFPSFDVLYGGGFSSDPCSYEWETEDGLGGSLFYRPSDGSPCIPRDDQLFSDIASIPLPKAVRLLFSAEYLLSTSRRATVQLNIRPKTSSSLRRDDIDNIISSLHPLASHPGIETTTAYLQMGHRPLSHRSSSTTESNRKRSISQQTHLQPARKSRPEPPTLFSSAPLAPLCYSNNETCRNSTDNCSGNGHCYAKHRGTGDSGDCFVCKCSRTVVRTGKDGKPLKTVQWGGPLCDRKDVTVPFWLIGGFTVLIVSVVGTVIGMMFRMGQEELPGVLGAGVAAPKR